MSLSKVRLKENIGIVAGEASISKFKFFLTPLKNIVNRIGDYVLIDHPIYGDQCPVLAIIKNIENFEEVIGATLGEKSVQTMAVGHVLGYMDLREATKTGIMPVRQMLVPVCPGTRVYLPYHNFLQAIFSRNLEGKPFIHTVHLGVHQLSANDEHGILRDINLYHDVVELCNQHTLLTSMTGSGKTHTATIIAEELVNKHDHNIIIFDPHGEYTTIGANNQHFKEGVKKYGGLLREYPFNIRTAIYAHQYKETVNTLIKHKIELGKESNYTVKSIKALSKDELTLRKLTIFNMSGLSPSVRGRVFTDCMLALYEGRMKKQLPPFFLIVEEAGNLISNPEAAALLQRIASEGIKYGISMCLLCQHPAEVNDKILSQMGIQMMGRIVDPEDLECLKYMAQEEVSSLPNFRVGEWVINGVTLLHPIKIRVRERYSKHP
jgi:hypothetical protein